jgi:ubiquinone biosynthesis monooxygenase Coq7
VQTDHLIIEIDKAIRTLHGVVSQRRPTPLPEEVSSQSLTDAQRQHAAGLMRVNHVGEVCAQALYQAQRITSTSPEIKKQLAQAATEEEDHLAWCAQRLEELGSRPSLLNPIWYGGSFALGILAGLAGDAWSLGFVVETEKQVEKHLDSHLQTLPENDLASRAIVDQMRREEIEHGNMAMDAGARELPELAKKIMQVTSQVMTKTAYRV